MEAALISRSCCVGQDADICEEMYLVLLFCNMDILKALRLIFVSLAGFSLIFFIAWSRSGSWGGLGALFYFGFPFALALVVVLLLNRLIIRRLNLAKESGQNHDNQPKGNSIAPISLLFGFILGLLSIYIIPKGLLNFLDLFVLLIPFAGAIIGSVVGVLIKKHMNQ